MTPLPDPSLTATDSSSLPGDCAYLPAKVLRLVVDRPTRSPFEGFGMLRLRTYSLSLEGVSQTPRQIFAAWRDNFAGFWPAGNYYIPCGTVIEPGLLGVILLTLPLGMRIVTGAKVIFADDTSFTLTTLLGHMFAGWITFSVFEEGGQPVIQTQALLRPGDPLFELAFLGGIGQHAEDVFWRATLRNVARSFGVEGKVKQVNRIISHDLQWRYFGNFRYNAALLSLPGFFGTSLSKVAANIQAVRQP